MTVGKDAARHQKTMYLARTQVCRLFNSGGIWVAHVVEQVRGIETRRRKAGKQWVSTEPCGGEEEDAPQKPAPWLAIRQPWELKCSA